MSFSTDERGADPPDRLVVGHVTRAHGIRGDVVASFYSDDPRRFGVGDSFVTEPAGTSLTISASRPVKGGHVVGFVEIDTRDQAEALRGERLTIPVSAQRTLEADEFWPDDLIGLEVRNPDGSNIGTVVDVVLGDAQDRLIIETASANRVDVPFVNDLVPHVERDDGFLVIIDMPGLLE